MLTSERARALGDLLESGRSWKDYSYERDNTHVVLDAHPFGLDTSLLREGGGNSRVILVADPGGSEESVQALLLMLNHVLMGPDLSTLSERLRLRVVRVAHAAVGHDLYFEAVTFTGTFMCGGCTDYSGAGGSAGRKIASVFELVTFLYGIPVEDVTIPAERVTNISKSLSKAYYEGISSRQAA
jgi:hypothetical protein